MTDTILIRSRYMDASAAVKLVVEEEASDVVRKYFEADGPFYITYPCALEVFSVLKVMHLYRKQLNLDQYLGHSYAFSAHLRGRLKVEPFGFDSASTFFEVEDLARRHTVDLVDAIQLHTLLHGRFSNFVGPHKSLLITADESLAGAARALDLDAWDCMREPRPSR